MLSDHAVRNMPSFSLFAGSAKITHQREVDGSEKALMREIEKGAGYYQTSVKNYTAARLTVRAKRKPSHLRGFWERARQDSNLRPSDS